MASREADDNEAGVTVAHDFGGLLPRDRHGRSEGPRPTREHGSSSYSHAISFARLNQPISQGPEEGDRGAFARM